VADAKTGHAHFLSRLAFETDPSDVYTDLKNKISSITVIDARTPEAFAHGHVPGAIYIPWRKSDTSTTTSLETEKILVTYCDGVYCNTSTKASARLTALGFRVKEMLDGMNGWKTEGYPVEETVVQLSLLKRHVKIEFFGCCCLERAERLRADSRQNQSRLGWDRQPSRRCRQRLPIIVRSRPGKELPRTRDLWMSRLHFQDSRSFPKLQFPG
jgi:rhodanese-related sulfurtransferase